MTEFERNNEIIILHESGISLLRIKEMMNLNFNVYDLAKELGMELRDNSFYRKKYDFNEKYFETIDTEYKAYWLGFIWADGYISGDRRMGISLSKKDEGHLDKFKKDIDSNHEIKEYRTKENQAFKEISYHRIILNSVENVNNLIIQGVLHNKTYFYEYPKLVPDDLVRHFIRGFFDGNGCISGTSKYKIKICGLEELLEWFRIKFPVYSKSKLSKRKQHQVVMTLDIGGKNNVIQILEYMYKDCKVSLYRKHKKCNDVLIEYGRPSTTIISTL